MFVKIKMLHLWKNWVYFNLSYYMASSASGQDDPNRVLWLATQAGKMKHPLGTTRCVPQGKFHLKPYNKSFIDQICSVKMAGYWPRSFFGVYGSQLRLGPETRKKELGQYPAILTSHLVNNPYVLHPYLLIMTTFLLWQLFSVPNVAVVEWCDCS